ncbi:hypothetical protein [Phenylobacterium sp.]|uniref:hypothetical protein n=1 Tax=Phenylobacterium sp. TaxID=1871053 RepID=UPI003D2742D1
MAAKPPSNAPARGGASGCFPPPALTSAGGGERRFYEGAVTTFGRSKAVRLEERFFVDHPEFGPGARVEVRAIAPGCVLMAVEGASAVAENSDGVDPLVGAYLAFIGADLNANPHRVRPLDLSPVVALIEGVTPLRDDEDFPDDSAL